MRPDRAVRQALVWIDSRQAIVLAPGRRLPVAMSIVRSDTPIHRRSIGHVRHDPATRHGGGQSQTAAERARLEHRERFLARVTERLATMTAIDVIGPGDLPNHLAGRLRSTDREHGHERRIDVGRAGRLTPRQLVAAWKSLEGLPVRRLLRRRHGWDAGRMGKPGESLRPAVDDSRPSPEDDG